MYDHPERWPERSWLRSGAEDEVVPALLQAYGCRSVLVPGAGIGRQYTFLEAFDVRGFDISPTLVGECQRRFPRITTVVADVIGCERLFGAHDAVFSSAVLAHVPPRQIRGAVRSFRAVADRLVIVREYTSLARAYHYQWAHNYEKLMRPWRIVHREVTDERSDARAELIAFSRQESQVGAQKPAS
jgi:hypothetical protein